MPEKVTGSLSEHFFTMKEAAAYIGVTRKTFQRYMKKPETKGGPPRRRFGRQCVRIPIEQFLRWANPQSGT